ncbi:MAG: FISUMP domain-containing protein [Prolixibacteraceae bacterium]|jgi:uncharacterized protein (TIGR02145 family)|nr:FISUMP domain-containing protein [Prolixibacteraceae bacterium]MDD4754485.1 FISUMP domain-containing protein [Prolixibacteraceae bacterium]
MQRFLLILAIISGLITGCVKDDPHSSKILELGFSIKELHKKGVTAQQLFNAGASLEELIESGIPPAELDAIDEICLHDIIMAGGGLNELAEYLSTSTYSLDELMDEGLGVGFLKSLGYEDELKNKNYLGTVQDIDGNLYNWVRTGSQIWMTQNLRTTRYSDGVQIIKEIPNQRYIEAEDSLSCYLDPCDNNPLTSKEYCDTNPGFVYTYTAATRSYVVPPNRKVQGICPNGWRLPTIKDIEELFEYTEQYYPAANSSAGLRSPAFWHSGYETGNDFFGLNIYPNTQYSFTLVSGFDYLSDGSPEGGAIYWTSDDNTYIDPEYVHYRSTYWLVHGEGYYISTIDKRNAICVRCMKDDDN